MSREIHRVSYQQPLERAAPRSIPYEWSTMKQILHEEFANDPDLLDYLKKNKRFFVSFFEARLQISNGGGSEKFNKFRATFDNDKRPKTYVPERFEIGRPIIAKINASLFPGKVFARR